MQLIAHRISICQRSRLPSTLTRPAIGQHITNLFLCKSYIIVNNVLPKAGKQPNHLLPTISIDRNKPTSFDEHVKRSRLIALIIAFMVSGTLVLSYAPSLLMHLFIRSKAEVVHSPEDIKNALLALKQQKPQFSAPHLVFKISRQPHISWHWIASWKGAGFGSSWTQADKLVEFSKVGENMLVYSIPIRWQEDGWSIDNVASEIETNVSPTMTGSEKYSTSQQEYERLKAYLKVKTPDVDLDCSISKDATGRIVRDIEYLDGTLSLPQSDWAGFVQGLFKDGYQSTQPIYMEQVQL